ncbi:MaoC/PaaZ C-terminal domain-containing protein [Ectopseudomonas mendocina]|uniref:MaoC/PaaZ C-terminal domain-containing protein n=1 Tax=Ectopseudomonas mendocina TaxID=300 RepID=A0ABZ2RLU5_ECTME
MTTEWLDLPAPAGLAGFFIGALLRRKVTGCELPALGVRCPVTVDTKHLERYRKICGFTDEHHLPATYPHLLTFPLQMQLLTDKRFPFPLLGLVHLENHIRVVRPLAGLGPFTLTVQLQDLQPHAKGVTFSMLCQLHDQLGLLWQGDSRYLCRSIKLDQPPAEHVNEEPLPQTTLTSWQAPADIGRRYARIAGDYNPIHMFALTAKLFGFPRAIAHGLWNKGRALAELGERLPKAGYEVGVRFQKPVLLPSQVHLQASDDAAQGQFSITGDKGQSHFSGYWRRD